MERAMLSFVMFGIWGVSSAIVMFVSLFSWSNQKITTCAVGVGVSLVLALTLFNRSREGLALVVAGAPALLLFVYL